MKWKIQVDTSIKYMGLVVSFRRFLASDTFVVCLLHGARIGHFWTEVEASDPILLGHRFQCTPRLVATNASQRREEPGLMVHRATRLAKAMLEPWFSYPRVSERRLPVTLPHFHQWKADPNRTFAHFM